MASIDSVRLDLSEVRGTILVLMQEGDTGSGFEPSPEWADHMFRAWELAGFAIEELDRAEGLA